MTPAPFPSSREGSGREGAGTAREGKGLPAVPFLPALPIGLPHIWPCMRACMPHCCSHVAHVCPHIWPCMRVCMPYCCSHVAHVCPHIWPCMRVCMPHCCSHIWPMYEPITASKYGLFLPLYAIYS